VPNDKAILPIRGKMLRFTKLYDMKIALTQIGSVIYLAFSYSRNRCFANQARISETFPYVLRNVYRSELFKVFRKGSD